MSIAVVDDMLEPGPADPFPSPTGPYMDSTSQYANPQTVKHAAETYQDQLGIQPANIAPSRDLPSTVAGRAQPVQAENGTITAEIEYNADHVTDPDAVYDTVTETLPHECGHAFQFEVAGNVYDWDLQNDAEKYVLSNKPFEGMVSHVLQDGSYQNLADTYSDFEEAMENQDMPKALTYLQDMMFNDTEAIPETVLSVTDKHIHILTATNTDYETDEELYKILRDTYEDLDPDFFVTPQDMKPAVDYGDFDLEEFAVELYAMGKLMEHRFKQDNTDVTPVAEMTCDDLAEEIAAPVVDNLYSEYIEHPETADVLEAYPVEPETATWN